MRNPFIHTYDSATGGYLTVDCSINRVFAAALPSGEYEEDLTGVAAGELFSAAAVISLIKGYRRFLNIEDNIPDTELPRKLAGCLSSEDASVRDMAEYLTRRLGSRLGAVFLILKTGLPANREARPDWNEKHWNYWGGLDTIILAGGMSSGILGETLKKYALELFDKAGVVPYRFVLAQDGENSGTAGAAVRIGEQNGRFLLFDLGQTNLKASVITKREGKIIKTERLGTHPALYMKSSFPNAAEKAVWADKLNDYLISVMAETYLEQDGQEKLDNKIAAGIANYVAAGYINGNRGGYAKLSMLARPYEQSLSEQLTRILGRTISVGLIHDGTAAALNYKQYDNAACITLGTAFGVGFPDMREPPVI